MTPINNRHDTIITYDIDNLSSEGAETHVLYKGGKIKESTVYVYGAGGKMEIKYILIVTLSMCENKLISTKTHPLTKLIH